MLELQYKQKDNKAYYRTGEYSLRIVPIIDGIIMANNTKFEFIFAPNPSDISDTNQYGNSIQPDHATGFYTEVNEVGMKVLSIRGITGQKPIKNMLDKVMGGQAAAISSTFRGIIPGLDTDDGYNIWVALCNFFIEWNNCIREKPYAWAMLALNSKDSEVFNVLPLTFNKTRTAARPLSYGYAIEFQVIGEEVFRFRRSWLEFMSDIKSKVQKWQNAINKSALLASGLMQSVSLGGVGLVTNPATQTLSQMTAGLQSFVTTAEHIQGYAAFSQDRLLDVAHEMVRADTYSEKFGGSKKTLSEYQTQQSAIVGAIPPTQQSVRDALMTPAEDLLTYATDELASFSFGTGERSAYNLDNPLLDNYFDSLDMMAEVMIAVDQAPLPDNVPAGSTGQESQDMHRAARLGSAGLVLGREDEFASAALAASTEVEYDATSGTNVRRSKTRDTASSNLTLSQLASTVMQRWSRANNERISPQLAAFRKWYLSMGDPATFSPMYKIVSVSKMDTIYSLAMTHLNSWTRWCEIALINNLKYPYISPVGGPYQRQPGDTIYIPTEDAVVPIEVIEQLLNIQNIHDRVSLQDLFLGFDIEVGQNGDMRFDVYDVAHITGISAYEQEVAMLLGGKGGITSDRREGPIIRIGTKSRGNVTVQLWHGILKKWFNADPRVAEVEWLQVRQEGGLIAYTTHLKFVQYDTTVTLAGQLRV